MAVSRTLRFQILRRDNHTCRACGRSAPEVRLQVDHVIPEALGGRTEPDNLQTLCADCNGGKSATPPDAAVVAQVAADAERWAAAQQLAAERLLANRDARNEVHRQFVEHWTTWEDRLNEESPFESGWQRSIDTFIAQGLPLETLLDCVDKAMRSKRPSAEDRFKYMCGIAWSIVRDLREATASIAASGNAPERPAVSVEWMLENWDDLPPMVRDVAEVPAWRNGRYDLTQSLLNDFTEDQVERYGRLGRAQGELDDEDELDGPESGVRAVIAAINDLQLETALLSGAIDTLMEFLPFDQVQRVLTQAHEELLAEGGARCPDTRVQARAVEHLAYEVAFEYLNSLNDLDREACLRRVEKDSPDISERDLVLEAAQRARAREAFGLSLCDDSEEPRS